MDNSKYKTKVTIIIITGVLLLSLVSFGYFYVSSNQSDKNRLAGGCFSTSFTDGESINLQNAFPQSFDEAKENKSYDFTITNTCNLPSKYYIILNVKEASFNSDFIDYTLNTSNFEKLSNTLENTKFSIDEGYNKSFIIGSGLLNQNESITHNLRIWIDESVSQNDLTSNSKFTAQIKIVNEVAILVNSVDKIRNLVKNANTSSTNVIEAKYVSGTCTNTLAYDGTVDNNLRYVGANPCNYVSFNNELWRIIGVMNNIDDGTGNKETRLKIVRNETLGSYSWDTSESGIYGGKGKNEWTQADLMNELNGDYLDTSLTANTMWYNGVNNKKEAIFDFKKKIIQSEQNKIGNTKWNIGGYYAYNLNSLNYYNSERGNKVYASAAPIEWIGKIALIYPSDFGFAVGTSARASCLGKTLDVYKNYNCHLNNWLTLNLWTLMSSSYNNNTIFYNYNGLINGQDSSNNGFVYPTLYLKADVNIIDGVGSEENPFVLA